MSHFSWFSSNTQLSIIFSSTCTLAGYVGNLGLEHPLNEFWGDEHALDYLYLQFNF
jgi:hypothetical protein